MTGIAEAKNMYVVGAQILWKGSKNCETYIYVCLIKHHWLKPRNIKTFQYIHTPLIAKQFQLAYIYITYLKPALIPPDQSCL